MDYTDNDLKLARRHVIEGRQRIADLEQAIAQARSEGRPCSLAEEALASLRRVLVLMIEHRTAIERARG